MRSFIKKSIPISLGIVTFLFIDGCRKDFSATAEHKASYGWEMYELSDYLKSKEWFANSVLTDEKWKDGSSSPRLSVTPRCGRPVGRPADRQPAGRPVVCQPTSAPSVGRLAGWPATRLSAGRPAGR